MLTFAEAPLLSAEVALVEKQAAAKQKLLLTVPRLGLSLIDDSPQELLYLSAQALHLELESSAAAVELQLSLNWLQLDNQLVVTQQPVLLRPNPAAHARNPYTLQLSVLKLRRYTSLHYFRHFSLFLQEMDVAIDWQLFIAVGECAVRLSKPFYAKAADDAGDGTSGASGASGASSSASGTTGADDGGGGGSGGATDASGAGSVGAPGPSPAGLSGAAEGGEGASGDSAASHAPPPVKCYVELLTLHPVVLNYTSSSGVGFANMQKLGASLHAGTLQFLGGYLLGFFNAIGVMLTSVDHARLRLNALVLQHPCEPYDQLLHRIGRHYIYQASQALLRVAGDLDLLGSPVAVLGNLGTGVWDFFYEPATALMHTPRALHLALAKGTLSLVRNTVMGTAQATSRSADAVAKGLAALSMDDDYMRRRAARVAAARPQTVAEGLLGGARNLGHSVVEGASGLIMSPLSGARRDGVKGALVGVAQGVVGVALKPAAGVLDLAAKSAEMVGQSVAQSAAAAAHGGGAHGGAHTPLVAMGTAASGRARARPPRILGPDATLQVYLLWPHLLWLYRLWRTL